jgi:hypothetical protein
MSGGVSAIGQIGTDEFYADKPDANLLSDPFPTIVLTNNAVRNLVETRMAALMGKSLPFPPSWNDVVYAYRMIYGRYGNSLGDFNKLARNMPNLLAAYSPAAEMRYTTGTGVAQGTTGTDVTGKTATFATSQVFDAGRIQAATGLSIIPLAAGSLDNMVWLWLVHQEPTVGQSPVMSLRRTASTDFLSFVRTNATTVTVTRTVASTPTTERTITVLATEPLNTSAYALRINGTVAQFYLNGTLYDTWTLNAAAQSLTGLNVGFDIGAVGRMVMGELEVWSTNYLNTAS